MTPIDIATDKLRTWSNLYPQHKRGEVTSRMIVEKVLEGFADPAVYKMVGAALHADRGCCAGVVIAPSHVTRFERMAKASLRAIGVKF